MSVLVECSLMLVFPEVLLGPEVLLFLVVLMGVSVLFSGSVECNLRKRARSSSNC